VLTLWEIVRKTFRPVGFASMSAKAGVNGNSKTDTPPPTATAICRDGSYSFSEHPYAGGTSPIMAASRAI